MTKANFFIVFILLLMTAGLGTASVYMCLHNLDGYGWFLFAALFPLCAAAKIVGIK